MGAASCQRWFRLIGYSAQNNLGIMYSKGNGVLQDYVQAHKWCNLAASRFSASEAESLSRATMNRDPTAAMMTPSQLAEAQKLASDWKSE